MNTKRILFGLALLAGGAFAVVLTTRLGLGQEPASMIVRQVLHLTPGERKDVIRLRTGDVLQLQPFALAVTPKFLSTKLRVRTEGAQALEYIGQSSAANDYEGTAGHSAFLRALGIGQTVVHVVLVDKKDRPVEDYETTYHVVVTEWK